MEDSTKQRIDEMDYQSMLSLWRSAPVGHPYFQGDTGDYYSKVMAEKRAKVGGAAHVAASKAIGWMWLLIAALLLAGCVRITLPDGTEYLRIGNQQIHEGLITLPDGTELLFEGQKSELPTVTVTFPIAGIEIGGKGNE